MRILLTNDDGINAPGFEVLEAIARKLSDDVWVCAPTEENSGAGHSLTLHLPVRLREHGKQRYSVTGTPTDSVNLALRKLFPDRPPDLVISGVNNGENLADDVTYSGTISAAMEAALAGIPAVALSQAMRDAGHGFAAAEAWAEKVLAPLLDLQMAKRTVINVNFPARAAADVKGIRVVRQGFHDYARGLLLEGTDPRGRPYYWFGLEDIEHTLDHGTDLEAVAEGYVSVTPLHVDLTHHASLGSLAESYAA
ncbi:5'/3'-nucleotidase SurE [Altererythrobacter sp. Root672]|uniref:5'/3'-nucleotidase SurE n=1 Tax=Altererythrobacter sp. Root672 TaxID=1736584 RepID=UPI0006F29EB1|nr:5'/3'-nucleotidase SurE [Altererythrobacter sp. Root672]KRA82618.1 stationary phase survival protein SurE [Altererythrobacter sp. Root672]